MLSSDKDFIPSVGIGRKIGQERHTEFLSNLIWHIDFAA